MVLEGNWAIPYIETNFPDVDFATAEVPTVNGKKGTMAFTVAYVMNKDSQKKEAAWKLLSYLTGKEGMETWTSKGFALPTRKSVSAELGFDKDVLRGALVAGSSYATPWQAGVTLPTIMNNFNNQFIAAYSGQSSLNDAMKKAPRNCQQRNQSGSIIKQHHAVVCEAEDVRNTRSGCFLRPSFAAALA